MGCGMKPMTRRSCALLLGMAAPSLQALLQRQKLVTTANDFFAAVTLTRSEALRRGTPVVLLASGADGRIPNNQGEAPLAVAESRGHHQVANRLRRALPR